MGPGARTAFLFVAIIALFVVVGGILGEYLLRNWFRQSLPRFVVRRTRRRPRAG